MFGLFGPFKRFGAVLKTLIHFGPDLATHLSRTLSFDDAAKEARTNWAHEGLHLLPRRYVLILQQLRQERLISTSVYEHCMAHAHLTVFGPGVATGVKGTSLEPEVSSVYAQVPWADDAQMLMRASPALRAKIGQFDADLRKFLASAQGAFLLLGTDRS